MPNFRINKVEPSQWDELVNQSEQGTVFTSTFYLDALNIQYQAMGVYRGDELTGGVLLLDLDDSKELQLHDLIIHGGILFRTTSGLKKAKRNSHEYEMNCFVVEWLTKEYQSITIAFSPEYKDTRAFLWHEYHNPNPEAKFKVDLRYTSRLDISDLEENQDNCPIWKNLDTLRKRHMKQAKRERATFHVEPDSIEKLLQFYRELMKSQGIEINTDKIDSMQNLMQKAIEKSQGILTTTRDHLGNLLYTTFWVWDQRRAYYLFGAGSVEHKANYQGTHCFWNSFFYLKQNYQVNSIDFEGVNSPKRGVYKMSFGGDLVSYYEIYKGKQK